MKYQICLAAIYAAPNLIWAILVILLVLALLGPVRNNYGYWPGGGIGLILVILLILLLAGCATTAQYSPKDVHNIIQNGVQDYKTIRDVQHRK